MPKSWRLYLSSWKNLYGFLISILIDFFTFNETQIPSDYFDQMNLISEFQFFFFWSRYQKSFIVSRENKVSTAKT